MGARRALSEWVRPPPGAPRKSGGERPPPRPGCRLGVGACGDGDFRGGQVKGGEGVDVREGDRPGRRVSGEGSDPVRSVRGGNVPSWPVFGEGRLGPDGGGASGEGPG